MTTMLNARDPICLNIGTADCFGKDAGRCKCLNSTSFKHRKDRRCPFYKPKEVYERENKERKKK